MDPPKEIQDTIRIWPLSKYFFKNNISIISPYKTLYIAQKTLNFVYKNKQLKKKLAIYPIPPSLPAAGNVADLVEKPQPGLGTGRREETTMDKTHNISNQSTIKE